MNRFSAVLCCFFLSGCSQYQFSSNLDKENFTTYFQPSKVTIYEQATLPTLDYTTLGAVDGNSCQEKENDLPASLSEARTQARINAAAMNANGLVLQTCLNFERDKFCVSNIICYGQAIKVTPDND